MSYLIKVATGVFRHYTRRITDTRMYVVTGDAQQAWAWFGPEGCQEWFQE